MKTSQLVSALLFFTACASASAGTVTLYESSTPFTVSTNNSNVVEAQTVTTANTDILVNLAFAYSGVLNGNDFLSLWFGYDAAGSSSDKNVSADHTNGPNIGIKGNGGSGTSTLDLVVRDTGTGGNWLAGSAIAPNVTYQLFGHLYKSAGSSTYNRFDAWLNPTAEEMNTLTGADATSTDNSGITALNTFGFRSANLDSGDSISVSDVSIQDIPEPGTIALAGIALCGLAGLASKKRK